VLQKVLQFCMDTFGEWLREQRNAHKLTREEFANRVGCSVAMLRKMEDDERRPSIQIAELIANCLDIPLEERGAFVKVARGEMTINRLMPVSKRIPQPGMSPTQAPPRVNLPVLPTPLIGRQREIYELSKIINDPQCRMLTIVGPGGIGKTRLAIETASNCVTDFEDGVYFIPLAPIQSTRFLVPVISDAVGFKLQGESFIDPREQLLNYLNEKQMLLLVDNLEHLLGDPAVTDLFAALLGRAPKVKLLVTSRESAGLQGEWVFELQGLAIPDGTDVEGTSVELFLQRARRAHVGFDATTDDYPAIVRICQSVNGMPLGIELAAAWVRTLSCEEIAYEIERGLDFLSVSAKDLPSRHRSMRAVFDHSWKLLSEAEQPVLLRLSVFQGGFSREAAQQVAGATLPTLSALVTKSLIRRKGMGRYDQHELVRQYASERLISSGKQEEISEQHFEFFLSLAEESRPKLHGADQLTWLNHIDEEYDNMRAALEWSLRYEGSKGKISKEQERAVLGSIKLAGALYIYWWMRNYWSEGRKWLQRVLDQPSKALVTRDRVRALNAAVILTIGQGDNRKALQLAEDNLVLAIKLTDMDFLGFAYHAHGVVLWKLKEYAAANEQCEHALALFRTLEIRSAVAGVLQTLGSIALNQNRLPLAKSYLEECMQIFQEFENTIEFNTALSDLGLLAYLLNDFSTARVHQEKSLSLFRKAGNIAGIEMTLNRLGDVARCENNYEEALALYTEAMTIYRESGDKYEIACLLHNLGCVEQHFDRHTEARALFVDGLQLQCELNNNAGIAECLVGIAYVLLFAGEMERPARLFGAAEVMRENAGAVLWPANRVEYEVNLLRLDRFMDKGELAKAWREGGSMSLDQAIQEASQ
jgi:predicted ATPase/transcriptional regulator with XRE-family HTH domain